jgi:restriction system protein
LLLDYEDYLRHRHREQWTADCSEAAAVRAVPQEVRRDQRDRSDLADLSDSERWALYTRWLEHDDGAVRANALVCLINQTNYLLDQQIAALEAQFVGEGGYTEQLATARLAERGHQRSQTDPSGQKDRTDPSDPTDRKAAKPDPIPACPDCGKLMVLRTAKQGKNRGRSFWGCSGYPECKGVATP